MFSDSSTISHCEPDQAPCAPSASAAAICWPLPMPPAASTGTGATSLTTCGHSTIEPTSPQCPPPSPPWAMMMSTPASACLRAWYGEPHSAATLRPSAWMCSIMSAGGVPSALAISVIFGCCSATSTCGVAVASVQPSSCRVLSSSSAVSGTPWSVRIFLAKSRCSCGTMSLSIFVSSSADRFASMPSYLFGMTMSTP